MIDVTEKIWLAKDAGVLWDDIGGFGAIGEWHPLLSRVESEGEQVGSRRKAWAFDGSVQVERLVQSGPVPHCYRYLLEETAMPIRHFEAELRVTDHHDGTSTIYWTALFEPTAYDALTIGRVRHFLRAGLENIAAMYGMSPVYQ